MPLRQRLGIAGLAFMYVLFMFITGTLPLLQGVADSLGINTERQQSVVALGFMITIFVLAIGPEFKRNVLGLGAIHHRDELRVATTDLQNSASRLVYEKRYRPEVELEPYVQGFYVARDRFRSTAGVATHNVRIDAAWQATLTWLSSLQGPKTPAELDSAELELEPMFRPLLNWLDGLPDDHTVVLPK